ncbi:hypothetical protein KUV47_05410 [Vannielia litorea]|uniref:hypothetical protein n=1 Tax=Vannielia litorea TaxID=1217970 RepID=UPI001C96D524|nr:hypothetical protein [Vannielia litorea]MBY6152643.1 hypothetical protein [Vannielia litorea]
MTEEKIFAIKKNRYKAVGLTETALIVLLFLFFTVNSNNFVFYFFSFLLSPLFIITSRKGDNLSRKIVKRFSFLIESRKIFENTIVFSIFVLTLIYGAGVTALIAFGANAADALLWPTIPFMGLVAISLLLILYLGGLIAPILSSVLPDGILAAALIIGFFASTLTSWALAIFFCYLLFIIYSNIVSVLYFFGIFLAFQLVRICCTIISLVTSPIEAMSSMPAAYREQLSKSVVLSPYFLLPGNATPETVDEGLGEYTSPVKFFSSAAQGAWNQEVDFGFQVINKILVYAFGTLSAFIATLVFFLPALIWRVLLKGSSIFFLPLLMIPNLFDFESGATSVAEQILTDLWSRVSAILLVLSHLLVPLALAALGTVIEFSELSPETEAGVKHLFALVSVWDGSEIRLDGIARLVTVVLVFTNFFLAKRVLYFREMNPSLARGGYEKAIVYASTAQAVLTIYWLFIQCARAMFEIRTEVVFSFFSRLFEGLTSISFDFSPFPVGF